MGRAVRWGLLLGLVSLVLLQALGVRAGLAASLMPRAEGPWLWTMSRAAGVTAFVALALEVMLGLLISTRAAERWLARAHTVELHRWLSAVALGLVGLHAVLLLGDRFVPFLSPHRQLAVALGVLGAWLALAVHASFALRSLIGPRTWRALHSLSFLLFALAVAHGLAAGSDGSRPWLRALYVVPALLVTALGVVRAAQSRARAAARQAS